MGRPPPRFKKSSDYKEDEKKIKIGVFVTPTVKDYLWKLSEDAKISVGQTINQAIVFCRNQRFKPKFEPKFKTKEK